MNPVAELIHIRKKAGRSLVRPGYRHRHVAITAGSYRDPMAETLCGAKPTTIDQSWAETRWAKNLDYGTCPACRPARTAAP